MQLMIDDRVSKIYPCLIHTCLFLFLLNFLVLRSFPWQPNGEGYGYVPQPVNVDRRGNEAYGTFW